jgi:hypothetical protein
MTMKHFLPALSVAVILAACSGAKSTKVSDRDDFKSDLQLASSTVDLASPKVDPALLNSLETKPQGAPQVAKTIKKGAGSRAVRSKTPTVRATPETDLAASDENSNDVNVVETAPVPEPTQEPVAVAPRPSPQPVVVDAGDGGGDYGRSGNGGGIFGPGGGIGGVIIRGGGVDGDHCEPHGTRGGIGGPIYLPSIPRTGGIFVGGGIGSRGRTSGTTSRGGVTRRGR